MSSFKMLYDDYFTYYVSILLDIKSLTTGDQTCEMKQFK